MVGYILVHWETNREQYEKLKREELLLHSFFLPLIRPNSLKQPPWCSAVEGVQSTVMSAPAQYTQLNTHAHTPDLPLSHVYTHKGTIQHNTAADHRTKGRSSQQALPLIGCRGRDDSRLCWIRKKLRLNGRYRTQVKHANKRSVCLSVSADIRAPLWRWRVAACRWKSSLCNYISTIKEEEVDV